MTKDEINKASILHVKAALGECRIVSYGMAFGLIKSAFESGVTWCNDQVLAKQNKATFIFDPEKIEIGFGHSPRGLRIKGKRPVKIELNINQTFNHAQFASVLEYLTELFTAMAVKEES